MCSDLAIRTLTLHLDFVGERVVCLECGAACSINDYASERSRRHLDPMQFQTIQKARIPRCVCVVSGHGFHTLCEQHVRRLHFQQVGGPQLRCQNVVTQNSGLVAY